MAVRVDVGSVFPLYVAPLASCMSYDIAQSFASFASGTPLRCYDDRFALRRTSKPAVIRSLLHPVITRHFYPGLATKRSCYSLKGPPPNIPIPKTNLALPPDILEPALEQALPEAGLDEDDAV